MMRIVKNIKENAAGNLECEILIDGDWYGHVMPLDAEYEIHDSSEWKDIKPCPQAEKDAHRAAQGRAELIAQIAALDLPLYTLERALAGDIEAQEKIAANELEKQKLRAPLK